ncbi:MAG: zinc-binding dehydrogenase, partial [Pseudomonadota bacterium]
DGETLLVHGGSSGIGTTAIQLAAARGARVIATAGSDAKCQACRDLGAALAVNYRDADFVAAVREATDGRGADVILDMVGGSYIPRNLKALAIDGRLVMIAFLGGSTAEVNFAPMMVKRQTLTGSTLRPQSIAAKADIAEALRREVWPLLDSGALRPVMDSSFPLAQATDAHRRMESSAHIGKIVLRVA